MSSTSSLKKVSSKRISTRSAATRAKIISVAERLFAEKGIDGVTLNEIGKAAGQRNAAVCQYHFGDKEMLLQAVMDKHVPGIAAQRHTMLDQLEHSDNLQLSEVVRAFIDPVAEKLLDKDGGEDFIRINAQLVALHTASAQNMGPMPLNLPRPDRLTKALHDAMAPLGLPEAILKQRTMLAAVLLFHGLSDHTKMRKSVNTSEQVVNTELFLRTLEDGILALLSAPVSSSNQPASE